MQALFVRAAQVRCTCNCSFCNNSTVARARRHATTVSKRRIRIGDVSSLLFSSTLAAAAFADGRNKDTRRDRWDNMIQGAKDDLKRLDQMHLERVERGSSPQITGSAAVADHVAKRGPSRINWFPTETSKNTITPHHASKSELQYKGSTEPSEDVLRWADGERKDRISQGFEELKGLSSSFRRTLISDQIKKRSLKEPSYHSLCERSGEAVWDTPCEPLLLSKKRLRLYEWRTLLLVKRLKLEATMHQDDVLLRDLCHRSYVRERWPWKLGEMPPEDQVRSRDEIMRVRNLIATLAKVPRASFDLQKYAKPERPTFNSGYIGTLPSQQSQRLEIYSILKIPWSPKDESEIFVDKICNALLASNAPPDIHTYNSLLLRFSRLKYYRLFQILIDHLEECKIEPNEVTLSIRRDFYQDRGMRLPFDSSVQRIECSTTGPVHGGLHSPAAPSEREYRKEDASPRHSPKSRALLFPSNPQTSTAGPSLTVSFNQNVQKAMEDVWSTRIMPSIRQARYGFDDAGYKTSEASCSRLLDSEVPYCVSTHDIDNLFRSMRRDLIHIGRLRDLNQFIHTFSGVLSLSPDTFWALVNFLRSCSQTLYLKKMIYRLNGYVVNPSSVQRAIKVPTQLLGTLFDEVEKHLDRTRHHLTLSMARIWAAETHPKLFDRKESGVPLHSSVLKSLISALKTSLSILPNNTYQHRHEKLRHLLASETPNFLCYSLIESPNTSLPPIKHHGSKIITVRFNFVFLAFEAMQEDAIIFGKHLHEQWPKPKPRTVHISAPRTYVAKPSICIPCQAERISEATAM